MASSTEPTYVRIAAELTRRINDAEIAPGGKVPSTRQVAQEFGVALATATKALDVLRTEGLVITRPRSGTVVAPRDDASRTSGARALTRHRVLAEAVAIADTEGLEAVSMRAVAGRCGVAPMSLYRFVEGKDELVAAMADAVYAASPFTLDPEAPWRERAESLGRELWRLHRDHPWLGRTQPLTRPMLLPNLLRFGDRLLGALEGLGLPPKTQFDMHVLLYNHVAGLAANIEREDEALSLTGVSAEEWTDRQYVPHFGNDSFRSTFPHMARLFGPGALLADGYDMDIDELFELGYGLLLDGIEAYAQRQARMGP
ncbi:transcriptional regulator, TetR family [Nocardioides sp. YR527]|uniref:GntR family transcriptional regulator n=1 Tax=Nocardioides sp. YR527 TaxID=1881028 RepID=UPI00087DF6F4|nr:GntR family transcriptional regulator [Nocardioides sp. YR527]SDJ88297.1 transcriptional regulator, TetR family [Nocardioides sp. YR527]